MTVKRPKRNSRFDTVKQLYGMVKGGYATEDMAKGQFAYGNVVVFQSELDKFALENPDINIEDFTNFLKNTSALKAAGKKGTGTTKASSLASDEKITAIQIASENVEAYRTALTALHDAKAVINGFIQNKAYTCGYYITQSGKKAQ